MIYNLIVDSAPDEDGNFVQSVSFEINLDDNRAMPRKFWGVVENRPMPKNLTFMHEFDAHIREFLKDKYDLEQGTNGNWEPITNIQRLVRDRPPYLDFLHPDSNHRDEGHYYDVDISIENKAQNPGLPGHVIGAGNVEYVIKLSTEVWGGYVEEENEETGRLLVVPTWDSEAGFPSGFPEGYVTANEWLLPLWG